MAAPFQLPRFQFSLRWLLIAITIVAVVLGLGAFIDSTLGGMLSMLVLTLLPPPLLIIAIFGRGLTQAFAIGALVPLGVTILRGRPVSLDYSLSFVVTFLFSCAVSGGLAAATRAWLEWPPRD